jgi:hypothetical protein
MDARLRIQIRIHKKCHGSATLLFVIIFLFSRANFKSFRAYLLRTKKVLFTFSETAVVAERWQRTFNETMGRYQQLTDQLASGDQAAHMLPILWQNQLDQVKHHSCGNPLFLFCKVFFF